MIFNFEAEGKVQTSQKTTKFNKSGSLSSVKTATEGYLEQQTLCRKINIQQKERFIQMITEENYNMKEAAKEVNISYSTAKKIYSKFKQQLKGRLLALPQIAKEAPRCNYISADSNQSMSQEPFQHIQIISTIAGRQQPQQFPNQI